MLNKKTLQETIYSETGGKIVRYKRGLKKELVENLVKLVETEMIYCRIVMLSNLEKQY